MTSWEDDANCRGMDTDLFFVHSADIAGARAAQRICRDCPVADKCLEMAMEIESGVHRHGVFGGLTANQRIKIQSTYTPGMVVPIRESKGPGRPLDPITHGTPRGYRQHMRREGVACQACTAANTEYRRVS